jgi:hypothetical protein
MFSTHHPNLYVRLTLVKSVGFDLLILDSGIASSSCTDQTTTDCKVAVLDFLPSALTQMPISPLRSDGRYFGTSSGLRRL